MRRREMPRRRQREVGRARGDVEDRERTVRAFSQQAPQARERAPPPDDIHPEREDAVEAVVTVRHARKGVSDRRH